MQYSPFALCAGSASGLTRRIDRASAIAVMPLPLMTVYFTANDRLAVIRAGHPYEGLVFGGGPFVIGLETLLSVAWAARRQGSPLGPGAAWNWKHPGIPIPWTRVLERNPEAMNPNSLPGYVWLELPRKVLHADERYLEFTDKP